MKTRHRAALIGMTLVASLHGEPSADSRTYVPSSLDVPIFTPPAPPVEKPLPTMRIDSQITVPTGNSRTLTILRGEASDLPDIPEPVVIPPRQPRQINADDLARHAEQRRRYLNFSAEVYENSVSVLRWQHPDTAEPYQAIWFRPHRGSRYLSNPTPEKGTAQ